MSRTEAEPPSSSPFSDQGCVFGETFEKGNIISTRGMTMRRKVVTFSRIVAFMIVLSLGLPIPSEAQVFWTDDFENHLTPNWDTSACTGTLPGPQDGCNGFISTNIAHSGTRSFQSHFPDITQQAGTYYDRPHTATNEVWVRVFYYTNNFIYYPNSGTKLFYNLSSAATQTGSELVWEWPFGSREMRIVAISHPSLPCPNGTTDSACGYSPNMASKPLTDNQWYCLEFHAKANNIGQSNGLLEFFVDGTQTIGYYNRILQSDATQWDLIRLYTQYGQGDRYIDDLAVGKTRIGCPQVVAPTPPSALNAR